MRDQPIVFRRSNRRLRIPVIPLSQLTSNAHPGDAKLPIQEAQLLADMNYRLTLYLPRRKARCTAYPGKEVRSHMAHDGKHQRRRRPSGTSVLRRRRRRWWRQHPNTVGKVHRAWEEGEGGVGGARASEGRACSQVSRTTAAPSSTPLGPTDGVSSEV